MARPDMSKVYDATDVIGRDFGHDRDRNLSTYYALMSALSDIASGYTAQGRVTDRAQHAAKRLQQIAADIEMAKDRQLRGETRD
jgi:hypothetical protein